MSRILKFLFLSLLCLLCSCERRPLVEDQGKVRVRVVLNTDSIANVTCGIYNDRVVPSLGMPGIISSIIVSGFSLRGLSLVTMHTSL